MQNRRIADLEVSCIGLGGMPLSLAGRPDESDAVRVIHAAIDAGVTWIDTADVYCLDDGDIGHNERLIARALREHGRAEGVVVATKGGLRRPQGDWVTDGRPARLRDRWPRRARTRRERSHAARRRKAARRDALPGVLGPAPRGRGRGDSDPGSEQSRQRAIERRGGRGAPGRRGPRSARARVPEGRDVPNRAGPGLVVTHRRRATMEGWSPAILGDCSVTPHSVGCTNQVLRSGRRDSTRSQANSPAWVPRTTVEVISTLE
mgnify:CR=1 FL=1